MELPRTERERTCFILSRNQKWLEPSRASAGCLPILPSTIVLGVPKRPWWRKEAHFPASGVGEGWQHEGVTPAPRVPWANTGDRSQAARGVRTRRVVCGSLHRPTSGPQRSFLLRPRVLFPELSRGSAHRS
ncbi:hypothetical protein HJG60_011163 [Phyllostomus discolor]|uniref:Uncharacterized protein n=1 Tax=Phyllostomus discolor TaxID=89673 RepID=A0A834A707_9CHIR|nr:hypothetical protein HJG60_011163 [Phyllostomus discolor]